MVLHEYKHPKCFPNTSLAIRLSRLLIRTDTSLDRDSRGSPRVRDRSPQNCVHHCARCILSRLLAGLHECEIIHHRTVSTYQDSRGTPRARDHSTRPELCPRTKTLVGLGLHECERRSTKPEQCPRTKTLAGLHECERRSTSLVGLHECDQIPSSQVPNTFHTTHVQRQTKTVLA